MLSRRQQRRIFNSIILGRRMVFQFFWTTILILFISSKINILHPKVSAFSYTRRTMLQQQQQQQFPSLSHNNRKIRSQLFLFESQRRRFNGGSTLETTSSSKRSPSHHCSCYLKNIQNDDDDDDDHDHDDFLFVPQNNESEDDVEEEETTKKMWKNYYFRNDTITRTTTSSSETAAIAFVSSSRPKMIVFDKDGTLSDCTASLQKWVYHMKDRILQMMQLRTIVGKLEEEEEEEQEQEDKQEQVLQEQQQLLIEFYNCIGWDGIHNTLLPSAPIASGTWDDILNLVYNFLKDYNNNNMLLYPNQTKTKTNHHHHRYGYFPSVTKSLIQTWHTELGGDELHGQDIPVIDDLKGMIRTCQNMGYVVGICTSDDRRSTMMAMKFWNIDTVVDVSICGDEVSDNNGKPSPVPLQMLCSLTTEKKKRRIQQEQEQQHGHCQQQQETSYASYLPQDCIVVGDTTSDTGMAKSSNAGFCVGVLTGSGTSNQLLQTGAHLILPHVGHIPTLLQTFEHMKKEMEEEEEECAK